MDNSGLADDLQSSDAPHPGEAPAHQQGSLSAALRLAGDALKAKPGSAEALAGYSAVLEAVARQEEAMVAFGKLLISCAKEAAGHSEVLKGALARLLELENFGAARLDQLTQIAAGQSEFLKNTLPRLSELENFSAGRLEQLTQIELSRTLSDLLANPRHDDPKRLLRYGFKVYSQCDEDGIIQEIFRRIGTTNRTFVEFGVESGSECNTVKLLLEGWRGLWLDGQQNCIDKIRTRFAPFIENRNLAAAQAHVTAENINSLISQNGVTGEIDLLSIDIDRNDYWVWKAINVVEPRVVVIEYNATLRPPLSLVVPYDPNATWGGGSYFGASLEALVRLGRTNGYRLVGCGISGTNAFFVRNDLAGDLFINPSTAEEHYEPPRYYFAYLRAGHPPQLGPYVTV